MVVLTHSIGIETNFELQLLLWFQCSFSLLYLENAFFLDLVIFQMPVHIFLINVANHHSNKFGIASIRLSHYLSLEVNKWWLENELRIYAFAFDEWSVWNLYWLFNGHGNLNIILSCLFWEELDMEFINFFRLKEEAISSLLVLIFFRNIFLIGLAIFKLIFIYFFPNKILTFVG